MGRRKKRAPRRGSLAYRPRARAKRLLPRVRNWPVLDPERPSLLGFAGYKAGMLHVITIDDRPKTPNYGKPLFNASTAIACPPMKVIGFRAYTKDHYGIHSFYEVYAEDLPRDLDRKVRIRPKPIEEALKIIEDHIDEICRFRAIVYTRPKDAGLSQKKPFIFEVGVGGGSIVDQLEYLKSLLGKEVRIGDVFKPGMSIDVAAITKGKGFQGPIKRFGVKRKQHKARKTVRIIGVLGPWHPAAVTYTVPMAGQTGFHQRIEYNKRILIIGEASMEGPFAPKGGFPHFGLIRTDYVVLRGSIPGPAKRVVVLRAPMRPKGVKIQEPKILEASIEVKA